MSESEIDLVNLELLQVAAEENISRLRECLLLPTININAVNEIDRNTALMLAIRHNNIETVQILVACSGIDLNAKSQEGNTALIWAAELDNVEIVRVLISCTDIDLNLQNHSYFTALNKAISLGFTDVANLLITCDGIDVNLDNEEGIRPLIFAASLNLVDVTRSLLACSTIKINNDDNYYRCALTAATINDNIEIVKILLDSDNINPNYDQYWEGTPFQVAIRLGHYEIIQLFLTYAPFVDVNNSQGWRTGIRAPPLITAMTVYRDYGAAAVPSNIIEDDPDPTIVRMLLDSPFVDINVQGQRDDTPLIHAAKHRSIVILEILLAAANIDLNKKNKAGETALAAALKYSKHYNVIMRLITLPEVDVSSVFRTGLFQRLSPQYSYEQKMDFIIALNYRCRKNFLMALQQSGFLGKGAKQQPETCTTTDSNNSNCMKTACFCRTGISAVLSNTDLCRYIAMFL